MNIDTTFVSITLFYELYVYKIKHDKLTLTATKFVPYICTSVQRSYFINFSVLDALNIF